MANFQPMGKVYLGNVPFDNSYRHTMTFPSRQAQADYFMSCMNQWFNNGTYTYVRMNNAIKVGFNAEHLYTFDYVMYQNANYGDKWFYAFITEVNYVNENTTELVLELDVMQTWYFDYQLVEGFVEREHVNDDSLDANLIPEPEMSFNLVAQDKWTDGDFNDRLAVIQTNAVPIYETVQGESGNVYNTVATSARPLAGGIYSNIFNGAMYFAFHPWDFTPGGADEDNVRIFLTEINRVGSADSISNIFLFPEAYLAGAHPDGGSPSSAAAGGNRFGGYAVETGKAPIQKFHPMYRPTTLDGYTPRNNKLFTYPYCFARAEDNAGHYMDWKWELWQAQPGGRYQVMCTVPFDADATAFVVPVVYDGEQMNMEWTLAFPCTSKASWTYSAYQTWSAQNALNNNLSALASAAMIAIPAARGIGVAAKALGAGVKAMRVPATQAIKGLGSSLVNKAGSMGMQAIGGAGIASMTAGALGLGNLAGNIYKMSKVPDAVKGGTNGNSLWGIHRMGYNLKSMCIQSNFAKIVDDFFDMYGYAVEEVKIPNREGRPAWNYVKMQNSCHRGNVPASDMEKINDIYDAGVTFWHTPDIGNYSLYNGVG